MASLKPSEDIYDPKTYHIKAKILFDRIKFVSDYYPAELCHTIRMMTDFGKHILIFSL